MTTQTIESLAKQALERPSDFGWWGREDMFVTWGWSGVSKHRDSDLLQISNFEVMTEHLMGNHPDDFQIVGMGHWAVGHVDYLIVRVLKDEDKGFDEDNITEAFKEAVEWVIHIKEQYPIASEEHYYELVSNMVFEYTKEIMPDEVYIEDSLTRTVSEILSDLERSESYDYDNTVPDKDDILMTAYNLRLCSYEHKDFWDEFTEINSLPTIKWDDITESPSGVPIEIPGQMSIDEVINEV